MGDKMKTFEEELESLINKHMRENDINTLNFILAQYILGCLASFKTAAWHGRNTTPELPKEK